MARAAPPVEDGSGYEKAPGLSAVTQRAPGTPSGRSARRGRGVFKKVLDRADDIIDAPAPNPKIDIPENVACRMTPFPSDTLSPHLFRALLLLAPGFLMPFRTVQLDSACYINCMY